MKMSLHLKMSITMCPMSFELLRGVLWLICCLALSLIPTMTKRKTLLYHDGCTVLHQASTFGDHTVNTLPSIKERPNNIESMADSTEMGTPLLSPDGLPLSRMDLGTPFLSPDGVALSRMAATNGSFLFSPDNMGRAKPSIRAKERAKVIKDKPSTTMLPAAHDQTKKPECSALVVKRSYSHESAYSNSMYTKSDVGQTDDPSIDSSRGAETVQEEINKEELSDNDQINGGMKDASQEVDQTPLVSNIVPAKKKYPATPFPEANLDVETAAEVNSSPQLETLSSPLSTSLTVSSLKLFKDASPSNVSISSFKSAKGGKKKSRKSASKSAPKSSFKTRQGFVKERVSHFQHRIEEVSSNGAVNGRLKRNHSYRYKSSRRETKGDGVLAPRKPVLQTTYIRSVPICIAKTRSSLGNSWDQGDSCSISGNTYSGTKENTHEEDDTGGAEENTHEHDCYSDTKVNTHEDDDTRESIATGLLDDKPVEDDCYSDTKVNTREEDDTGESVTFASKYSGTKENTHEETPNMWRESATAREEDISYTSKYTGTTSFATKPTPDDKPVSNVDRGSVPFSDTSSCVSETTDSDPFNCLLGKMSSEDEESSSSEEENSLSGKHDDGEVGKCTDDGAGEIIGADNAFAPPSAHLPFKAALVKPTELHLHNHQQHSGQPKQYPLRPISPLSLCTYGKAKQVA